MGFPYIPVLIASAASAAAGSAVTYYIINRKSDADEELTEAAPETVAAVQAAPQETIVAEPAVEVSKPAEAVKETPPKSKGKKKK